MREEYYELKHFSKIKSQLKDRREKFSVIGTTYTKRIKTSYRRMMFSEEGERNDDSLIMTSSVRASAKKFIEDTKYDLTKEIVKPDFFNVVDKAIKKPGLIVKVDIKQAYWEMACKKGIITPEVDEKLRKVTENYLPEYVKDLRLKALGALATTRHFQDYEDGLLVNEYLETEITKPLYMEICHGIDDLMKKLSKEVKGCRYYYWDCIFMAKGAEQEAVDFLKDQGYSSEMKEVVTKYVEIGGVGYIMSKTDSKSYITRKENADLLDDLLFEEQQ